MKLLTFLGTGNYQCTTYFWDGKEYKTDYAPVASCHFLQPQQLILFVTSDARNTHLEKLTNQLPAGVSVDAREIPTGQDEKQLWEIFSAVASAVSPKEEVAFDITHGLRSFPLIGLLAAAFLRSGFNVKVQAVLYGGYDVRDKSTNRTPMFDLTPMITLLEWAVAADRFNRTGDSRYLASIVKEFRPRLAQVAKDSNLPLDEVGGLGNLAGALTSISHSLQLIRPQNIAEQIESLPSTIEKAKPALEWAVEVSPLSLLLDQIVDNYAPLGLKAPNENPREFLHQQRRLIDFYIQREQWVQAITLAREWMVNWFMFHLGFYDFTSEDRQRVENDINTEAKNYRKQHDTNTEAKNDREQHDYQPGFPNRVPEVSSALKLWNDIIQVRNDINHAGFRKNPADAESLIGNIRKLVQSLQKLPI
ncbi:MAG: TIGR02221 family CRISPR-associated protein [Thermanaerothrix sp.]|uniref:TIGR02221 family CRISPR-associated protein n=1 Tax=Thermanaerothrix sp. TaxID=2972675 RepID=UPI003C7B3B3A